MGHAANGQRNENKLVQSQETGQAQPGNNAMMYKQFYRPTYLDVVFSPGLVAWRSGNTSDQINEVTLHRAELVL